MRKSQSDCPAPIADLMKYANAVKTQVDIPRMHPFVIIASDALSDANASENQDIIAKEERKVVSSWIESMKNAGMLRAGGEKALMEFLSYLIRTMPDSEVNPIFFADSRLDDIRLLLTALYEHAEHDRSLTEKYPSQVPWSEQKLDEKVLKMFPPALVIRPAKDGDGRLYRRLEVRINPMIDCIQGADIRRFRICHHPTCGKFFWATRLEVEGCEKHNDQIRKFRKKLNDAIVEYTAKLTRLEDVEKRRDKPIEHNIKSLESQIEKLLETIRRNKIFAKRNWK